MLASPSVPSNQVDSTQNNNNNNKALSGQTCLVHDINIEARSRSHAPIHTSTTGNMAGDAEEDVRERLKAALWFAVGKMVDEEMLKRNRNVTPQFIGALTEMAWAQIENVAIDLENFSRHAGRSTITTDDVLLLTRRNQDLHDIIKDFVDQKKAAKPSTKTKR